MATIAEPSAAVGQVASSTSVPHAMDAELKALRSAWELPAICQYAWLFQSVLHMDAPPPEALEAALVAIGKYNPSGSSSSMGTDAPAGTASLCTLLSRLLMGSKAERQKLRRSEHLPYDALRELLKLQLVAFQREQSESDGRDAPSPSGDVPAQPASSSADGPLSPWQLICSTFVSVGLDPQAILVSKQPSRRASAGNVAASSATNETPAPAATAPLTSLYLDELPVLARVAVLKALCDWRQQGAEFHAALAQVEPQDLRVEPFGEDALGARYYYFGFSDCRVYRQFPPRSATKPKKKRKLAPKGKANGKAEGGKAKGKGKKGKDVAAPMDVSVGPSGPIADGVSPASSGASATPVARSASASSANPPMACNGVRSSFAPPAGRPRRAHSAELKAPAATNTRDLSPGSLPPFSPRVGSVAPGAEAQQAPVRATSSTNGTRPAPVASKPLFTNGARPSSSPASDLQRVASPPMASGSNSFVSISSSAAPVAQSPSPSALGSPPFSAAVGTFALTSHPDAAAADRGVSITTPNPVRTSSASNGPAPPAPTSASSRPLRPVITVPRTLGATSPTSQASWSPCSSRATCESPFTQMNAAMLPASSPFGSAVSVADTNSLAPMTPGWPTFLRRSTSGASAHASGSAEPSKLKLEGGQGAGAGAADGAPLPLSASSRGVAPAAQAGAPSLSLSLRASSSPPGFAPDAAAKNPVLSPTSSLLPAPSPSARGFAVPTGGMRDRARRSVHMSTKALQLLEQIQNNDLRASPQKRGGAAASPGGFAGLSGPGVGTSPINATSQSPTPMVLDAAGRATTPTPAISPSGSHTPMSIGRLIQGMKRVRSMEHLGDAVPGGAGAVASPGTPGGGAVATNPKPAKKARQAKTERVVPEAEAAAEAEEAEPELPESYYAASGPVFELVCQDLEQFESFLAKTKAGKTKKEKDLAIQLEMLRPDLLENVQKQGKKRKAGAAGADDDDDSERNGEEESAKVDAEAQEAARRLLVSKRSSARLAVKEQERLESELARLEVQQAYWKNFRSAQEVRMAVRVQEIRTIADEAVEALRESLFPSPPTPVASPPRGKDTPRTKREKEQVSQPDAEMEAPSDSASPARGHAESADAAASDPTTGAELERANSVTIGGRTLRRRA